MRVAPTIKIDPDQKKTLERQARARSLPSRVVERSRIVLMAASGLQDVQIAARLGITAKKVARWRARFQRLGVTGLLKDAPRPGRTPTITQVVVQQVIEKTTKETPAHSAHWSTRTMAAAMGISETSVRRIWRAHGLNPRSMQTANTTEMKSSPKAAEIRWRNRPNGSAGEAASAP